ncbi:hypothetical protein BCR42DRAFT_404182 [Absidia repens]|uniref:Cyclin N-terminal domain-containing protein n=1 Tax=Absidia repens TaxID=90262 RepID=A0A1X2IVY2_9FUNG|nr:hypothetical protein BCR42DRAFT_404182 [Absidia repens]
MKADTNCFLATRAYEDYSTLHAALLLHIINIRKLEPLSTHVVEQISKAMIYCGDYFEEVDTQQDPVLPKTMTFIHSIMNRTTLPWITSVEDAIRISCTSQTSIPVICPATTTICAIYYLNRYKEKYGTFTHSYYATQRLFLVAYLVAAKFIRENLKSVVVMQDDNALSALCPPSLCSTASTSSISTSSTDMNQDDRSVYIPKTHNTIQSFSSSSTTDSQQQLEINHQDEVIDTQATKMEFERNAAQLLMQMGNNFMHDHSINTAQLCSMEVEFLHFMDYQLYIGPSTPLKLWPWFYTVVDYYDQLYHIGVKATTSNATTTTTS